MQAVMVHVNVGTANTLCGLLSNAALDPMRRCCLRPDARRSPKQGMEGGRNIHIHWTQEMYDQGGMVREAVKWDYELRNGAQAGAVVARAVEAAMAPPRGPVYLMLPREPLSAPAGTDKATEPRSLPSAAHPDPASVARLADWLMEAERPLLIASSVGRVPEEAQALARLAERFGLPVVAHTPRYVCLASDHPMHHGFDPGPFLDDADVIVAIESDVPWMPSIKAPGPSARIAHICEDLVFRSYPMRVLPSHLSIRCERRRGTGPDAGRIGIVEPRQRAADAPSTGAGGGRASVRSSHPGKGGPARLQADGPCTSRPKTGADAGSRSKVAGLHGLAPLNEYGAALLDHWRANLGPGN